MNPNQRLLQLNYYCTGEGPPPASTSAHAGEEREGRAAQIWRDLKRMAAESSREEKSPFYFDVILIMEYPIDLVL
jgi:hypothetical protein